MNNLTTYTLDQNLLTYNLDDKIATNYFELYKVMHDDLPSETKRFVDRIANGVERASLPPKGQVKRCPYAFERKVSAFAREVLMYSVMDGVICASHHFRYFGALVEIEILKNKRMKLKITFDKP